MMRKNNFKLSSLRGANRGQAIFELGNKKLIGRSLEFFALQKIGMTIGLIFLTSTRMTNVVRAECTPTPNCAELGYTATSCEGKFVRCPFDTSKLFCLPCDSSYQYSCNGTGPKGKGATCNSKYIECECSNGYDLVDGACVASCSYTLTSLPTGCSAVSDSCVKNATTYYSSICTSCKNGYTLNSGTCRANTCSGYDSILPYACSSYIICTTPTATKYKCSACENGYELFGSDECIDVYCYEQYKTIYPNGGAAIVTKLTSNILTCTGTICTGNDGIEYCVGVVDI